VIEKFRFPSFKTKILRHVFIPLAITWILGTATTMMVASYFVQKAHDRSLLDDAYLISSRVLEIDEYNERKIKLNLTSQDLSTVLFDPVESIYFAIYDPDGKWVAGHGGLTLQLKAAEKKPAFTEYNYQGKSLRSITLHHQTDPDFYVVMAQTTTGRDSMLENLLYISILPQIFILLLLLLWLRKMIRDDLQPLSDLEDNMRHRDSNNLNPLNLDAKVSDIQKLCNSFNSLMSRIQEQVKAQREFSGNIAHEMRTPLAGIRALAEYGVKNQSPEVMKDQLVAILGTQDKASRLIDQLIALALADEARNSVVLETIALDEVARDTLIRFLPRADAMGIDLGGMGLDAPCNIKAHRPLLEGILNNLIDNAMRHGCDFSNQKPNITVAIVKTIYANEPIQLRVIDEGSGLSNEQKQQALARWSKGKKTAESSNGSGLGLSIVSEYARLMNAQFSLEDNPQSKGLMACVRFLPA
jgi:two-component system sensor histidine kinase TctE